MNPLANDIRRVSSADGAIVLHLRRGTMFRVNPMGSKILDLLAQGASLPRIAEQLSAEFGVALGLVQADIQDFMACLRRHGVVDLPADEV
jgi:hypothetical protein